MLLPLLKSKYVLGCRQAATKFAGLANFNSCRFVAGKEVPRNKKESELKFSPHIPPDKYLERRKTKFYEQFASKEGKTSELFESFLIMLFTLCYLHGFLYLLFFCRTNAELSLFETKHW